MTNCKMKKLYKYNTKTGEEISYGFLDEEDIKLTTKGYVYDEELKVYTRKNSNWGFYVLD